MDLLSPDTAAEPAPAAVAAPAETSLSLDQLIAAEVAAQPADSEIANTEQPSTAETSEQPAAAPAAAASVEGTSNPAAEQPVAEPAKEQASDDISVRRARSILAEANRKEQQARQAVASAEQELIKQLIANPRNFLAKHGKSIAELIDIDLGQDHDPIKDEPKAIKPEDVAKLVQEQVKAALEQTRQEQQLNTIKDRIRNDIGKDQRFELINRSKSQDTVLEFMQEYWDTHGKAIPWDKAAHLVETDLRERFGYTPATATATKPSAAPAAAKVPQRESTATGKPAATTTTLTNNEIRSAGPPADDEPTDPDQLIKWLVAKEEKRQAAQAQ